MMLSDFGFANALRESVSARASRAKRWELRVIRKSPCGIHFWRPPPSYAWDNFAGIEPDKKQGSVPFAVSPEPPIRGETSCAIPSGNSRVSVRVALLNYADGRQQFAKGSSAVVATASAIDGKNSATHGELCGVGHAEVLRRATSHGTGTQD